MITTLSERPRITELVKVDKQAISEIDQVVEECGMLSVTNSKGVMAAFQMSKGIARLRELITPAMMKDVMDLMGTSLGFRTDKDRDRDGKIYDVATVKDCVIEAMLRGARLTGNEFNIIASNCYLTKEYFIRMMAELPDLTDIVLEFGVPQLAGEKGALVPVTAHWIYKGRRDRMVCDVVRDPGPSKSLIADSRVPVKVNSGQGTDAILGKAERKVRARIMSRITGTTWTDADVDDVGPVHGSHGSGQGNGNGSSLKDKLKSTAPGATAESSAATVPESSGARQPEIVDTPPRSREQPPFEAKGEQSSEQESLDPFEGEAAKDYYVRIVAAIKRCRNVEQMLAVQDAIDAQLGKGYFSKARHAELSRQLESRQKELPQ